MLAVSTALAIELTQQEKALASRIAFDLPAAYHDPDAWRVTADAMEELTRLLFERKAIPEARLKYVADPECNIRGHGSFRHEIIERNGYPTPTLRNPAFMRHLRYFLNGPDLPRPVIEAFRHKVMECSEPFTGRDALTVAAFARQLTRTHSLDPRKAHEELYKLALECGLDAGDARSVRDSVMKVRR